MKKYKVTATKFTDIPDGHLTIDFDKIVIANDELEAIDKARSTLKDDEDYYNFEGEIID